MSNKMPLRKINNLKKSIVVNHIKPEEITIDKQLKHVITLKKTVLPIIKEQPKEPEKYEFDNIPLKKITNMLKTTKLYYEDKQLEPKIEFDNIPLKKITNLVKTPIKENNDTKLDIPSLGSKPLKKINSLIKSPTHIESNNNESNNNISNNKISIEDIKYMNDIDSDDELDIKIQNN